MESFIVGLHGICGSVVSDTTDHYHIAKAKHEAPRDWYNVTLPNDVATADTEGIATRDNTFVALGVSPEHPSQSDSLRLRKSPSNPEDKPKYIRCPKCRGTGEFVFEYGSMAGQVGKCLTCEGHGDCTPERARRHVEYCLNRSKSMRWRASPQTEEGTSDLGVEHPSLDKEETFARSEEDR